jgi:hypothetical protein
MKDCYYDLGLHFILLDDSSQSYILKLRDRVETFIARSLLRVADVSSQVCKGFDSGEMQIT